MYVRPATLLALLLAVAGASSIYRSKPVKLCNLPTPIAVPGSHSTTIRGCRPSFATPLVAIQYDIQCDRSSPDSCLYSTYLSSGDDCQLTQPPVPKSFLSESICETSLDPVQSACQSQLQVLAGAGDDIAEVCLVIACLGSGGCPVNATIRLEGAPIVKEAAEIQEQIGQEETVKPAYPLWIIAAFAVAALLAVAVAIIWYVRKQRQSRSLSEVGPAANTTGIWVLATGEDYDNRSGSARDPTINDM